MKNIFLLFILLLSVPALQAQRRHLEHDSTRIGFTAATDGMRASQIVRNVRQPIELTPVHTRMCFDETIDIDMVWGGGHMEQALFMNNDDGYIAYTRPGINGAGPIDMIMPEIEDFHFGVFGFKGNAYNYYNQKDDRSPELHHWVMTGNTDEHKYIIADAMLSGPLQRKSEQRLYCDAFALAQAYKLGDQSTVWFLYGDRYPAELHVRKYYGGFGIGVVRADEGIYVVMEVQAGNNHSKIMSIDKMRTCFDPSVFVPREDDYRTKERTRLDAQEQKLAQREADAEHERHCIAQRMAIINYDREQITQARRNLDNTKNGNIYQDRSTQKAFLDMMDPLAMVQEQVLNCNLTICLCDSDTTGSASIQNKKACAQRQLQILTGLSQRMRDMDRQYTNIAEAQMRKNKLYMDSMRDVQCN